MTLERSTRRGSKLLGKVTAVSPTEVSLESSGTERKIPVNEIQRINFAGEPTPLRQARTAVMAGQYEQALETLAELELPDATDVLIRQEAGFYRILALGRLALRGGGDPQQAGQEVLDFLRRERNTYHFFEAVELLGNLSAAAGNYDDAARYYQQLAKAPWPEYELRTYVLTGGALRAQGKFAEAAEQYARALQNGAGDSAAIRQQALARIGQAACQAESGETDAAIAALEEVIAKNDPADETLFTQAYLALGAAYRKASRPLEAVLAYLHVDLLFYGQREAHAEALYYLTVLWPQVEQPARAVDARQLLQSRYAGTIWAKRASE